MEWIKRYFIDSCHCEYVKISETIMRVVIDLPQGRVVIMAQFYISSIRLFMFHSQVANPAHLDQIQERINTLNKSLSDGMRYGISSIGGVAFNTGYAIRRNDPARDAGLDGFCELIGKTAPTRLCELNAIGTNEVQLPVNTVASLQSTPKEQMITD